MPNIVSVKLGKAQVQERSPSDALAGSRLERFKSLLFRRYHSDIPSKALHQRHLFQDFV
jgi:hypothetical protein